jgi:predicted permease
MRAVVREFVSRCLALFGGRRSDAQLSDEICVHFDLLADDFVRRGMTPVEARAAARREFGGVDQIKERYRDQRGWPFLESIAQDVRYAIRGLRRSVGFTTCAVLSLALGIGATTAIFSVFDALILRSLPVRAAEELYVLRTGDYSFNAFQVFREATREFTDLFATSGANPLAVEIGNGPAESASVSLVSGAYFGVLGVSAIAGRTFDANDDRGTLASPVAVASYAFWQRRFGRDPALIGRTIRISGASVTIVGVAAPGFFGEEVGAAPDLWVPLTMWGRVVPGRDLIASRTTSFLVVIGRAKVGADLARASSELTVAYRRELTGLFRPDELDRQRQIAREVVRLEPAATGVSPLRARFSRPLQVLLVVVALLLLIACANVANLLLVRMEVRRREIGLRVALGVTRARLVRQVLTESVLLSGAGAAIGLALASWGRTVLLRLVSTDGAPVPLAVNLDGRLLMFAVAVSVGSGLLFGLAPIWRVSRDDVARSLTLTPVIGQRGIGRVALSSLLVVCQIALSLVLLAGAGLFLRTLANLRDADLGFPTERLLVVELNPLAAGYRGERLVALCSRLLRSLAAAGGVSQVTLSENGAFTTWDSDTGRMRPEGYVEGPEGIPHLFYDLVGPGYFSAMGITLAKGRDFDERDTLGSNKVVVISEEIARLYFPGADPIGRRMSWGLGPAQQQLEVVGVARSARQHGARDGRQRRFYVPYFQQRRDLSRVRFMIRTAANPDGVASLARQAVQVEDRRLSVVITTANTLAQRTLVQERLVMTLSTAFAVLALTLASIGLFGLMAYRVARRTGEIGVRMALGATRGDVLRAVFRHESMLVCAGAAVGIPLSIALSQLARSLFYGVEPTDVPTFAGAMLVIALAGLLAGAVPAWRAGRVEPIVALRHE